MWVNFETNTLGGFRSVGVRRFGVMGRLCGLALALAVLSACGSSESKDEDMDDAEDLDDEDDAEEEEEPDEDKVPGSPPKAKDRKVSKKTGKTRRKR